jgi:hypothetical protein
VVDVRIGGGADDVYAPTSPGIPERSEVRVHQQRHYIWLCTRNRRRRRIDPTCGAPQGSNQGGFLPRGNALSHRRGHHRVGSNSIPSRPSNSTVQRPGFHGRHRADRGYGVFLLNDGTTANYRSSAGCTPGPATADVPAGCRVRRRPTELGNGSAMRVAPIGFAFDDERVLAEAVRPPSPRPPRGIKSPAALHPVGPPGVARAEIGRELGRVGTTCPAPGPSGPATDR